MQAFQKILAHGWVATRMCKCLNSSAIQPSSLISDKCHIQQVSLPSSSIHTPVFPVGQVEVSLCRAAVVNFYPEQFQRSNNAAPLFFVSATIGSISNSVLNIVQPSDPVGSSQIHSEATKAGWQQLERLFPLYFLHISELFHSHFDMCCTRHHL